jgi:transposase
MRRYELTDEQYALLAPLFAAHGKLGRPQVDHRQILNGLFWKLSSGVAWRDVPQRYGAWQTIYSRYTQWRRDGTWEQIVRLLQVQVDAHGKINWNEWYGQGAASRSYPIGSLGGHESVVARPTPQVAGAERPRTHEGATTTV